MSFRWFANGFVPGLNPRKQAVLGFTFLVFAGCGGGGGKTPERLVHGRGYAFSAPLGWSVLRSGREVRLTKGVAVLSVTRFPLLRAYRPALWNRVLPELDGAAAAVARQQKGTVRSSQTVTISGRRARRYDIVYEREAKQLVERLGFVLMGKTEYLLLCRYESGGDTDPCDRLLATFRLA
jgi:hypothetical protein